LQSLWAHTDSCGIRALPDKEFHNIREAFIRCIVQCGVVVLIYPPVQIEADVALAEGHTNSINIRASLDKEFHNLDVTVDRSHVQGSSLVVIYG
jgi:hypothetical protein